MLARLEVAPRTSDPGSRTLRPPDRPLPAHEMPDRISDPGSTHCLSTAAATPDLGPSASELRPAAERSPDAGSRTPDLAPRPISSRWVSSRSHLSSRPSDLGSRISEARTPAVTPARRGHGIASTRISDLGSSDPAVTRRQGNPPPPPPPPPPPLPPLPAAAIRPWLSDFGSRISGHSCTLDPVTIFLPSDIRPTPWFGSRISDLGGPDVDVLSNFVAVICCGRRCARHTPGSTHSGCSGSSIEKTCGQLDRPSACTSRHPHSPARRSASRAARERRGASMEHKAGRATRPSRPMPTQHRGLLLDGRKRSGRRPDQPEQWTVPLQRLG